MERETATATGQTPEDANVLKTEAAVIRGFQEPGTVVPAQHGPGPPASSTQVVEPQQAASAADIAPAPEAEHEIGLLKAELAAVKQSLATYESTLQQLLGVPSVPQAVQQLQCIVGGTDDAAPKQEGTAETVPVSLGMHHHQQQQEVASWAAEAGDDRSHQAHATPAGVAAPQLPLQQVGSPSIVEHLLASDVFAAEMQQQARPGGESLYAAAMQQSQVAADISNVPLMGHVLPKQSLLTPHPVAAGGVLESRLQASASAPSFDQVAAASAAQQAAAPPLVQRRSTYGFAGAAAGAGYDLLLHGSQATSILSGMRPPSPHHALVSPPPASVSRQQQQQHLLDVVSSQMQQAGPSGPVSIPTGMRVRSPGPAVGYSASPGFGSSILAGHGTSMGGSLLPPLPGRQGRHSDPTVGGSAGVISPPGGSGLMSHSYGGVGTSTGLQQLSGPSLAHLGPMQPDTAGSLSLSPDALAGPTTAAGRAVPLTSYESPDVMPSSSGAGADQFSSQQMQVLLQQGRGQEAVAAEQLAVLQQYQQQQGLSADPQQQLLAAMSQLDIKDPTVAAIMAASAAAGQAGGGLGAGMPLGGLWDPTTAAAAAATLTAAGGLDSSQAALQQQALQAQALASLQVQAEVQAYQQAQLVQQLQQQQQYNPYLQQIMAAQAAAAAALRQQPGQAALWALGYPGSSASSSSSGRRSSRGGDVQPTGGRDVRKGPSLDRGARTAAAAAGRQPRIIDETPDWRRVFVGNIGWWVDEEMLQRVFAEYGTILDAQVMWNTKLLAKGKRVNREFAFISFATPEEAGNAIRWLNGRYIEGITKDRDGLTVQYEAQGVGKSSASQGHQPPPHLQQIINQGLAGQQQQQHMMLQQLQQQQQQGALELLVQQQQQQQWPPGRELALLQQLGLGQQQLGGQQQQQAGQGLGSSMFGETAAAAGGAAAPGAGLPAAQGGQGV